MTKDLFRKALGPWPSDTLVIDLCAGFCRDSLCFSSWGFKVLSLERNLEVYELVSKTLQELAQSDALFAQLFSRIEYRYQNAFDFLKSCDSNTLDLIYVDPMYPNRKSSALNKKEMRFLKDLVGEDHDRDELIQLAWKKSSKRLVVKKPKNTISCRGLPPPTHIFKGSSTHYEVYLKTIPVSTMLLK